MKMKITALLCCLALLFALSCAPKNVIPDNTDAPWSMGFGCVEIELPKDSDSPLYIAGYKNGVTASGVIDLQCASAVWLQKGEYSLLLIGIDCVGLGSDTVNKIRDRLSDLSKEDGCDEINVFSTHTHAGIDTLGLWGPVAVDGKNQDFMENLIDAAEAAARKAFEDKTTGELYYGSVKTEGMQEDSRDPKVFDENLYQLRFAPHDGSEGIRMVSFASHAESLRGDNRMVSRDFVGVMSRTVKERSGDDMLFLPSAIGGLIMTPVMTEGQFNAIANMALTGTRLAEYALSITPESEEKIEGKLSFSSKTVALPLDNTLYMYYVFLGILGNPVSHGDGETGYELETEIGLLCLGDVTLALLPGEIFPELVLGEGDTLEAIAKEAGHERLLIIGLCNDEIGYIVPEDDYLVDEKLPYFNTVKDSNGENHYEETNSVGKKTASLILDAFRELFENIG